MSASSLGIHNLNSCSGSGVLAGFLALLGFLGSTLDFLGEEAGLGDWFFF